MLLTTRKFEVPALMRGDVPIEQPRALYNELPWPSWQAALPPDWTRMLPLKGRSTAVYINHFHQLQGGGPPGGADRSQERRVGTEWDSTRRMRWSRNHDK